MTIKEIRNEYKRQERFTQLVNPELIDYMNDIWGSMEALYTNGYVTDCSRDFMALANGYVINTHDYDNFHIRQTLGMRDIEATKRAAREFMVYWLQV